MIIAIDCDDVLIDSTPFLVDEYYKKYGIAIPLADSHRLKHNAWGCNTPEELFLRFVAIQTGPEHMLLKPRTDAVEAVHGLSNRHELHLVTARHNLASPVTDRMLDKYFSGCFVSVHHVADHTTKAEICKKVSADVLIDDKLSHLADAIDNGAIAPGNAIHFGDYVWNQKDTDIDGIITCRDWVEVASVIDGAEK